MHERESEVESALHPAGVGLDLAVGRVREADALEQLAGPHVTDRARQAVERRLQTKVLTSRQKGVERGFL